MLVRTIEEDDKGGIGWKRASWATSFLLLLFFQLLLFFSTTNDCQEVK
jgi:hypothetical protein